MKYNFTFLKYLVMIAFLFFGVSGVEFAKQHPAQVLSKVSAQNQSQASLTTINLEKKFYTVTFMREARADEGDAATVPAPVVTAPADEIPAWIGPTVMWLQSVPTVGPILVEVLKWLGVLSAVLTALSALMMALSKALVGVAGMAGFTGFAEKAQAFFDKILKYTKYFSMFNVQKPK